MCLSNIETPPATGTEPGTIGPVTYRPSPAMSERLDLPGSGRSWFVSVTVPLGRRAPLRARSWVTPGPAGYAFGMSDVTINDEAAAAGDGEVDLASI